MNDPGNGSDYPYAATAAARMLSDAIGARAEAGGESLRQLAGKLGYRSAVVLSHMRTGRLPIPVDRAVEIAQAVGMDESKFLVLVLEQRFPDVDIRKAFADAPQEGSQELPISLVRLIGELSALAGRPITELPAESLGVLREVVADPHPRRRWLTIPELSMIELARRSDPSFAQNGLSVQQMEAIAVCLSATH
ncbi:hypothetical protein [Sandarakinorhabdus sp.]|uniref:hypothetical protein n=1 Tax=Sandarakinorhabdus sp. TaxID=1916663 RepID=UPI003F6EF86E